MKRALTLAMMVLLVGGCATPTDNASGRPAGPGLSQDYLPVDGPATGESCPDQPPRPVPLPDGFTPVTATRCRFTVQPVPGDGEWYVRIDERAAIDPAAGAELVRALRQPSVTTGPQACTLQGRMPIIITLIDARNAAVVPRVPVDACQDPLPEAVRAIRSLPWQPAGETRIRQARTELEIATGCYPDYKPMVALTGDRPSAGYGPVFTGTPTALQVCRYILSDETIQTESATFRMGRLVGAGMLEGLALTQFLAATATAPSVTIPCNQPQADFAVLTPKGGGQWVTLETGGCLRLLDEVRGGLRQLTPATVAVLPSF